MIFKKIWKKFSDSIIYLNRKGFQLGTKIAKYSNYRVENYLNYISIFLGIIGDITVIVFNIILLYSLFSYFKTHFIITTILFSICIHTIIMFYQIIKERIEALKWEYKKITT